MEKRLRKKLGLGEFRGDYFEIEFKTELISSDEENRFWDRFIEMIEDAGLQFGGGNGPDGKWSGAIALDDYGPTTNEHREAVADWLRQQAEVGQIKLGKISKG